MVTFTSHVCEQVVKVDSTKLPQDCGLHGDLTYHELVLYVCYIDPLSFPLSSPLSYIYPLFPICIHI